MASAAGNAPPAPASAAGSGVAYQPSDGDEQAQPDSHSFEGQASPVSAPWGRFVVPWP
jgi:hypothetical protein